MLFGNSKIDFNIDIEGVTIPLVTHTKFLGVYLDKDLSWQAHLNHVLDKIQTKNVYYPLGVICWIVIHSRTSTTPIFTCIFHMHSLYGEAWPLRLNYLN